MLPFSYTYYELLPRFNKTYLNLNCVGTTTYSIYDNSLVVKVRESAKRYRFTYVDT